MQTIELCERDARVRSNGHELDKEQVHKNNNKKYLHNKQMIQQSLSVSTQNLTRSVITCNHSDNLQSNEAGMRYFLGEEI